MSTERIVELLKDFLPCVDDHQTLRVMADRCEEEGEVGFAALLRWTANEWDWERGMKLKQCEATIPVWARFNSQGWSRAVIIRKRQGVVVVSFPYRNRRTDGKDAGGIRAWWDLVDRRRDIGPPEGTKCAPKPRKGYSVGANAVLARILATGKPISDRSTPKVVPEVAFALSEASDVAPGQLALPFDDFPHA